jgi:hypothetical protein
LAAAAPSLLSPPVARRSVIAHFLCRRCRRYRRRNAMPARRRAPGRAWLSHPAKRRETPALADAGRIARLADLPAALRDEPALAQVLGRTSATVAVPEAARALVTAGLAGLTQRRPIVLAVPTSTEAERLAHDLAAYLGDERVELFPAWETLPFERVSPGVETMGRRLRVLWRLPSGLRTRPDGPAPEAASPS